MTINDPSLRHDIVMLLDVTDGNPNGDPDAANRPRVDPETGHGLITDVSIKRKIRDTLLLAADGKPGYELFIHTGKSLSEKQSESYAEFGLKSDAKDAAKARVWLCEKYVDLRLFGAVLSTKATPALGQIRGPLQISFARSIDPVSPAEHTITRQVHTTPRDAEKQGGTMGNKWTVPYGLYLATASYSAIRGRQTGISEGDLELLFRSMSQMFDHTSSASRPNMATRGLYVFTHSDAFGQAPMHKLVERVRVSRRSGIELPRAFSDYEVSVDLVDMPDGVTFEQVV